MANFNCAYHVECAKGKKRRRIYDQHGLLVFCLEIYRIMITSSRR